MPRYVTRSYVADDAAWDEKVAPTSVSVIVCDDLIDTGLLDAAGVKLYRVALDGPVGFVGEMERGNVETLSKKPKRAAGKRLRWARS